MSDWVGVCIVVGLFLISTDLYMILRECRRSNEIASNMTTQVFQMAANHKAVIDGKRAVIEPATGVTAERSAETGQDEG